MNAPMLCPYCGAEARLRPSRVIWKTVSSGSVWVCRNFPHCDSFVRCHEGTATPLGTMADKRLRRLRGLAHEAFDRIWANSTSVTRDTAYSFASLHMSRLDLHIGELNAEDCNRLIDGVDAIQDLIDKAQSNARAKCFEISELCGEVLTALFCTESESDRKKHIPKAELDRYGPIMFEALAAGAIQPFGEFYQLNECALNFFTQPGQ